MPPEELGLDEILEAIHELEGELTYKCTQLLTAHEINSLPNILAGSALYSAKQGKRIRESVSDKENDIPLVAWSTRCLFETRLALFYVLNEDSPEAAIDVIVSESARDEMDISIGLSRRIEDSEVERTRLQAELQHFARTPHTSDLAKLTGAQEEYKTFYKLLCKYTHPTKYLLFTSPRVVYDKKFLGIMVERAAYYLAEIDNAINYVLDNAP